MIVVGVATASGSQPIVAAGRRSRSDGERSLGGNRTSSYGVLAAMRALLLTAVVLISACATVGTSGSREGSGQAATGPVTSIITGPCPVTTPPPVALTPPPPAGTGPNPNLVFTAGRAGFLYGNDALITFLPDDGTIHPSDPSRGLPGGVKLAWWRIAHGDLVIATRRLDAVTAPQSADVPGGYGDTGFQVSSLKFPSPGCWQVTGTINGKTLTFVVNVVAAPSPSR